jgi:propanol-preferring alcohol dehydrogenase
MILLNYLAKGTCGCWIVWKSDKMPLVPFVINEYSVIGSLCGNYNELREVIELAKTKWKIKAHYT